MNTDRTNNLNEQFGRLRNDVRAYLTEMCLSPNDNSNHIGDFNFYRKCKNVLSDICGFDAPSDRYNQEMFDTALFYIIERLEV